MSRRRPRGRQRDPSGLARVTRGARITGGHAGARCDAVMSPARSAGRGAAGARPVGASAARAARTPGSRLLVQEWRRVTRGTRLRRPAGLFCRPRSRRIPRALASAAPPSLCAPPRSGGSMCC